MCAIVLFIKHLLCVLALEPFDKFIFNYALQGIRLLAQHHLGHLVQALIAWRQNVNEDIKKNFSSNNVVNVQGVCKRVRGLKRAGLV
jgi:hypothetical protein